jgi:hypothetical protein
MLHERIAAALGWTLAETKSFSLATLREMVRPLSPKLTHEITIAMKGLCLTTDNESKRPLRGLLPADPRKPLDDARDLIRNRVS